jgi:hypothetical protein
VRGSARVIRARRSDRRVRGRREKQESFAREACVSSRWESVAITVCVRARQAGGVGTLGTGMCSQGRVNILRTRSRKAWRVRIIESMPSSPSRSEGLKSFIPHMANQKLTARNDEIWVDNSDCSVEKSSKSERDPSWMADVMEDVETVEVEGVLL